jgi:pyridoxine 5-phosphate synthase
MFTEKIQEVAGNLLAAGISVSLFIDPAIDNIKACHRLGIRVIELNTGEYAKNSGGTYAALEMEKLKKAVAYAKKLNFTVLAGHGLTYQNITPIAALAEIAELNIGHSIIANATFMGLKEAVARMKELIS